MHRCSNALLVFSLVASFFIVIEGSYYCNHRWVTNSFYGPSGTPTTFQTISLNGPKEQDDLLVFDGSDYRISDSLATGTFDASDDTTIGPYCLTSDGDKLYVADIDGDFRDDLLCNKADGSFTVRYFMNGKKFADEEDFANGFRCFVAAVSPTNELLIGDFDGNNADDLMCLSKVTASAAGSQIHFNGACPKNFHYSERHNYHRAHIHQQHREKSMHHYEKHSHSHGRDYINNQCSNDYPKMYTFPAGSLNECKVNADAIIVGNANGDSRDDITCHDSTGTAIHTYLSIGQTSGNIFATTSIKLDDSTSCPSATSTIRMADVDGDGDDDVVCLAKAIAAATPTDELEVSYFNNNQYSDWDGVETDCDPTNFCTNVNAATPSYIVGDFNRDGKDDVMCYHDDTTATSFITQIIFAQ